MSERVFLSGPMGSGKSQVAAALGELWRCPVVDLDQRIEQRAGMAISQIFERRGESAFRELERSVLAEILGDPTNKIVALGGGTVVDQSSRRSLLREGTLITLRASLDTLCARVGAGKGRPLLTGSAAEVRQRLATVIEQRAAAYAECHAEIATDQLSLRDIAQAVDRVVTDASIVVPLGERTYRVEVGAGTRHALGKRARSSVSGAQALLVTDSGVEEPWGNRAVQDLMEAGFKLTKVCLPAGEQHKNIQSIEQIWDAALSAGVDRDTLVVAVGGGVVGDMAAFAASTILRGLSFGQLPTTLLAMVDSAVGGKTGIDRQQGKNLIGSFHQPRFVLCDVETLTTLPLAERRAGLAEVVKSAWIDSEQSVKLLEARAEDLVAGDFDATTDAVRMSVQLKARIVTEDERETGVRALLNLGHTVGHAIEAATGFQGLRHGEAVALGMVAAFRLSKALGVAQDSEVARLTSLLTRLGLPVNLDSYLDDRTLEFLGADKKRKGGKVRFVVPGAPGATKLEPLTLDDVKRLVRS